MNNNFNYSTLIVDLETPACVEDLYMNMFYVVFCYLLTSFHRLTPHPKRFGHQAAEVENISLLYEFVSVHSTAKIPVAVETSS